MKLQFSILSTFLLTIIMVASVVIPLNLALPYASSADPGIMRWDAVATPGSYDGSVMGKTGRLDIVNSHTPDGADNPHGSEVISMATSNSGNTVSLVMRYWDIVSGTSISGYSRSTATSTNQGINWKVGSDDPDINEEGAYKVYESEATASTRLITKGIFTGPKRIPGGKNSDIFDGTGLDPKGTETIRFADYSQPYIGKRRDIAFVTVGGNDGGRLVITSNSGWSGWNVQLNPNGTAPDPLGSATHSHIDYLAVKFSPNYSSDSSIVVVYADANATYYNIGYRDTNANTILQWAFSAPGIEVKNPDSAAGASPNWDQVNTVDLHLPSDFSGQSASLRRAYISIDAYGSGGIDPLTLRPNPKPADAQDGIYRIDDTTVYVLMDTSNNADKSVYSIAYFGTYASGKLLAGERMGFPCTATVPTWFTDSPTTCPIPCWYPALKPPTGAANQLTCANGSKTGIGAAIVDWNATGTLAYAATSSLVDTVYAGQPGHQTNPVTHVVSNVTTDLNKAKWYQMYTWDAVPNDESSLSISRNNGETWNQLSLIDTTIDWFNDVAVSPDCTTIYLASANRNDGTGCNEFDSVWRASINPNVTSPLPAIPPLGTYWERVYLRPTAYTCVLSQSDLPILRVVPSCTDKKDGEIVGWAAQNARTASGGGVMAWSPDYGDYWAPITPRYPVQDFAFESSTTLYTVNGYGMVQRLPYTGTSWSTNLPTYQTNLETAHAIVAIRDGKVLVGAAAGSSYPVSYSADKGVTFDTGNQTISGHGQMHVIFDVDFKNNNFIYAGDDSATSGYGTVYRNTVPSFQRWTDNDMMSEANGNGYIFASEPALAWPQGDNPPHIVGQFGLAQAWTGDPQPALYSAHSVVPNSIATLTPAIAYVPAVNGPPTANYVTVVDNATTSVTGTAPTNQGSLANNVTQLTTITKQIVVVYTQALITAAVPASPASWNPQNSAVCRTLKPRDGMPKPGIVWDCLDSFAPLSTTGVAFTLEPTSLKYCGCCTLDTNTTLYAIDDESGNWTWTAGVRTYALNLTGRWNAGLQTPPAPGYTPSLRQGMLWAYTDCLAKKGPVLNIPADKFLVGADPVTGRNQQVDLSWEQLCLSTWYQLQIAKDATFTMRINPDVAHGGNGATVISAVTGSILLEMDDVNMTSPAAWIAPGALPEAGLIYYWRIRSARSATGQIAASPWSEARSFTVKAGFIVNTPYYGVQLLAPNNACTGYKVKPASFSWSPWKATSKYQFDLARDPEFKTLVVTAATTTTGYEYSGTLDYSANYFWRVKALEVNGLNIPSDWSATFSLQTEPERAPPPPPPVEAPIPLWGWILIAIGAILVIVTIILIYKSRHTY